MKNASPHLITVAGAYELDHLAQWTNRWIDGASASAGLSGPGWFVHVSASLLASVTASIAFWSLLRLLARFLSGALLQLISLIDWCEAAITSAGAFIWQEIKSFVRAKLSRWLDLLSEAER